MCSTPLRIGRRATTTLLERHIHGSRRPIWSHRGWKNKAKEGAMRRGRFIGVEALDCTPFDHNEMLSQNLPEGGDRGKSPGLKRLLFCARPTKWQQRKMTTLSSAGPLNDARHKLGLALPPVIRALEQGKPSQGKIDNVKGTIEIG
jgi:hypothetical protein